MQDVMQLMQDAVILSAVIGAVAAIGGGLVAQLFAHWQTVNRDRVKYNIEVYQRFFAPIITDTFLYLDMRTNYMRGHDVLPKDEEKVYQRIFSHFDLNITEASPRFVFQYQSLKRLRIGDQTDFMSTIGEIELLHTFLDELYHVVKRYASFDNRGRNGQLAAISYYRMMYRFFVIASRNYLSPIKGAKYTSLSWMFGKRRMNSIFFSY